MKMHILSGGRLRMKASAYLPEAASAATLDMPVVCVLLRHPQGNVLFDTGCHPDLATTPKARLGNLLEIFTPTMTPDDHVLAGLKAIGLGPEDIDVVVNSHFHSDHCGCNEYFTKATFLVHALEFEAVREANALQRGYVRADWDHPVTYEMVQGERDIFGDGRLVIVELPGHTPGSMGLIAALDRMGTVLLGSDAVPLRATLDHAFVPKATWNDALFCQSLAEIQRIEAGGAIVICGHDLGQWQRLRKGANAYD